MTWQLIGACIIVVGLHGIVISTILSIISNMKGRHDAHPHFLFGVATIVVSLGMIMACGTEAFILLCVAVNLTSAWCAFRRWRRCRTSQAKVSGSA